MTGAALLAAPFDYGVARHPGWARAARAYLRANPLCVGCGRPASQVHHKLPYHLFPELEMAAANWAAVEPQCHLTIGHLGDWTLYEPLLDKMMAAHRRRVALAQKRRKK